MNCQHCAESIKPCDCGASKGREHWVDVNSKITARGNQYCARRPGEEWRKHEPLEVPDDPA